jgi:CRISPR/Cas system-associated endonuclease/helicase Cas3
MIFDTHWFWFLFIFQNQRTTSSRFFGEKSESKESLIPVFQKPQRITGLHKRTDSVTGGHLTFSKKLENHG